MSWVPTQRMKHRKKSKGKPQEDERELRKLENDIVEHSTAVLTCATEAAGEFVALCDRCIEEIELDLPYLRVALEIWAEHPELAQPLKHSLEQLLRLLDAQYQPLKNIKQELECLAADPAPHVHLDPVEQYRPLIRERLIAGHPAS
jgi:hypothetical protein